MICRFLEFKFKFKKRFRIISLDEKLTADAGYFSINCLEFERTLLRFLCLLEMHDNPQVKNLSDLSGIRLLYELCVACNVLPQVPVATLFVLFQILQVCLRIYVLYKSDKHFRLPVHALPQNHAYIERSLYK